ncbi:MAG: alpha/beta hydrolase [Coleofasciculaceae cyanobacterium]
MQKKQNPSWFSRQIASFSLSLGLGIFSFALGAIPSYAAERIAFVYPPFGEFYIYIEDLEIFAKEGKITNKFSFYAGRATPQQLSTLRDLLNKNFEVDPTTAYRFTHSPTKIW